MMYFLNIDFLINLLRTFFINIGIYYTGLKIINQKIDIKFSELINITLLIFIISIIVNALKTELGFMYGVFSIIILLGMIMHRKTECKLTFAILLVLISLSINYILFIVSIAISFLPNYIIKIEESILGLLIIDIIYVILLYNFLRMKKFRNGISFLKNKHINNYYEIVFMNISNIIIFFIIFFLNYNENIPIEFGIGLIIFPILMFLTIQKSSQLYYKQKMLVKELEETKQELENKKQEIEQLEKENLNFSKTSHSIAHKQKALEYKLNELILKNEIASEIDIKDRIEKISDDIKNRLISVELAKTEIPEIDDMLKYMQSECIKNKIDFQLQLGGNIYHMINKHIEKENLEILLSDMIKNAIIAINYSDNINKSILVRLGEIDNIYALYVYDSGIEFKIETFKNMGIKPCTTHADNGGTGIGLMNTFDTLKKYKASIIINEYNEPCKDNFTKVIIIKFDNKEETKICSYRYKEIEKEVKSENFKIEKMQKIH